MGFETAADRALMMDPKAFGTAATWTVDGGEAVAVNGIWSDPHRVAAADDVGVSMTAPTLTVYLADLPAGAGQGDRVEARGRAWAVLDIEPDGTGLARVSLQAAT